MTDVSYGDARVNWSTDRRAETAAAIAACDSPAEAALLVALFAHYAFGPHGSGADWTVTVQHPVALPHCHARLDFAIQRGATRVAVEVDGWAYHHATREQEVRDAARQRALEAAGWRVVRVEAWRALCEPAACVEIILAAAEQVMLHGGATMRDPLPTLRSAVDAAVAAGDMVCAQENRVKIARLTCKAMGTARRLTSDGVAAAEHVREARATLDALRRSQALEQPVLLRRQH